MISYTNLKDHINQLCKTVFWGERGVTICKHGFPSSSAAIDTAHYEPHKDPPRAEEGDDAVEKVVGSVPFHIRCGVHLGGGGGQDTREARVDMH